jgi:hypothetical protein
MYEGFCSILQLLSRRVLSRSSFGVLVSGFSVLGGGFGTADGIGILARGSSFCRLSLARLRCFLKCLCTLFGPLHLEDRRNIGMVLLALFRSGVESHRLHQGSRKAVSNEVRIMHAMHVQYVV